MSLSPGGPDLASLSSLDDPLRRRLYEVVTSQPGPVSRDEAASAAGIGRALAVYHLDKLVESGLLTASYQRPPGRSGPGAGRPAKMYARSDREFAVTVPPREYELAARLLVQAVEADPSDRSRTALAEAARRLGTELGSAFRPSPAERDAGGRDAAGPEAGGRDAAGPEAAGPEAGERDVKGVLTRQGYEPCGGADGVIRLRNCPFHQLAEQHRELVCGMNLALVEGLVEGLGADGWHPALDPRPGQCCVAIGGDRA
jgi:predicted ArsR family transcriptional regulator